MGAKTAAVLVDDVVDENADVTSEVVASVVDVVELVDVVDVVEVVEVVDVVEVVEVVDVDEVVEVTVEVVNVVVRAIVVVGGGADGTVMSAFVSCVGRCLNSGHLAGTTPTR